MPQEPQNQQVTQHPKSHLASASQLLSEPEARASLDRHRRKCVICRHPDRQEIEEQFVHWRSPGWIAEEFKLQDSRVLYRHAHATGLYEQRRRNYLFTLENVLECGDDIQFTAASYIKAVRAYACLSDSVHWNEPVSRVIHEYTVHNDASSRQLRGDHGPASTPPPASSLPESLADESYPPENEARSNGASRQAPCPERLRTDQPVHLNPGFTPATSSSLSPACRGEQEAPQSSAPSALPPQGPDEANPVPAKNHEPGSPRSVESCEQFLAAAIPILGASPAAAAQLRKAGLRNLASLAARHVSPPSNRHIPELESGATHRKQRTEVSSNRHKFTK